MAGQEAMPQCAKNPLDSRESDTAVDLKQLSGYTLKSQGTFLQKDKDRVKISDKAISLVNKFKQRIIDKRKPVDTEIKEVDEAAEEEKKP